MVKNTSQGHLVSITGRVANYARYYNGKALTQYLCGEDFIRRYAGLSLIDRGKALKAITRAQIECQSALPPLPPPCGTRVKWHAGLIAKMQKWAPLLESNDDLGRKLGMSATAAKLGRYRFVTKKNTGAATTRRYPLETPRTLTGAQNSESHGSLASF